MTKETAKKTFIGVKLYLFTNCSDKIYRKENIYRYKIIFIYEL